MHFSDYKQVMDEKRLTKNISKEMEQRIQKSIKLVQKNIRWMY
ncbi:spore germination protein LC [Bacillus thuringiensis HD-771]|uniref:Spore germination protein LC n=1 Tax=Bacillus thuringiensis HD-771 TaxID=1218175 RepID=A0A9W3JF99_BACTU|nr:spore germination protein LC [Bacillus thuringiensis HD-771]